MSIRQVRLYRPALLLVGFAALVGLAACGPTDGKQAGPGRTPSTPSTTASPDSSESPSPSESPTTSPTPSGSTSTTTPAPGPTTRTTTQAPTGGGQPVTNGKPGASNTGVKAGVALTVVTGDQTFSTAGVISGKDFRGFVKVTGSGVVFRNCIFRGRATSSNGALLDTERGTNTVVEDSEFAPSSPSATLDDIWSNNVSIYRSNIHGGVDGVKTGSNVLIQDSWIHDMTWFASDPNQGGGATHNDGVQGFDGANNVTLRHNTIDMSTTKSANAAFQNSATNAHVEGNWLDGGGCILNFDHHAQPLNTLYVTNNRFGRHSSYQCPILLSTQSFLAANSGNVWDDTGTPIPAPQRHD
jgi:hypothetical protein